MLARLTVLLALTLSATTTASALTRGEAETRVRGFELAAENRSSGHDLQSPDTRWGNYDARQEIASDSLLAAEVTAASGARFVVGPAGIAAEVGAVSPGGLRITLEAATRLAGRMGGRVGLAEVDSIASGAAARTFADSLSPGTLRLFNPEVTQFGGQGMNLIVNPANSNLVTLFPSSSRFMLNLERFTEIFR